MPAAPLLSRQTLLSLKLKELRLLALSVGAPSSGTKPVLTSRLWDEIHLPRLHAGDGAQARSSSYPRETRILSIDMGIQNFAYCTMTLPSSRSATTKSKTTTDRKDRDSLPKLYEWNRTSMLAFASSTDGSGVSSEQSKDMFHPKRLAEFANHLVKQLVINPTSPGGPPNTILIERQRFRTMGSSIVQEWTLRVNMLEAMLWAILRAEKERGTWTGEVYGVSPSLVASWWQAQEQVGNAAVSASRSRPKSEKLSAKHKKKLRVDRAARCLQEAVQIVDPAAQATYDAYLRRMSRQRGQQSQGGLADGDPLQKLDDLADCLLQALTWIAWERNRRTLLETDSGISDICAQLGGAGTDTADAGATA